MHLFKQCSFYSFNCITVVSISKIQILYLPTTHDDCVFSMGSPRTTETLYFCTYLKILVLLTLTWIKLYNSFYYCCIRALLSCLLSFHSFPLFMVTPVTPKCCSRKFTYQLFRTVMFWKGQTNSARLH